MYIGTVSVRYSRALYKYACSLHKEEEVYNDMSMLASVFIHEPKLRFLMNNPLLSDSDRTCILCKACGDDLTEVTRNFISFVIRKKRADFMQFFANSYVSFYLKNKGIIEGEITTSIPVNDEILARFKNLIPFYMPNCDVKKVALNQKNDPEILGGFILKFGSYQLDLSVKSKLSNIKKSLMRATGNA